MSHLLKQIAQHNAPGPRAAAVPVEDRSIRVVLGGQQAAPSLGRPRASGGDDAALAHAEASGLFASSAWKEKLFRKAHADAVSRARRESARTPAMASSVGPT